MRSIERLITNSFQPKDVKFNPTTYIFEDKYHKQRTRFKLNQSVPVSQLLPSCSSQAPDVSNPKIPLEIEFTEISRTPTNLGEFLQMAMTPRVY